MVKKKKDSFFMNGLTFVGLLAVGVFFIALFTEFWGYISLYSTQILWFTGALITVFTLSGILSTKVIKTSLKRFIRRFQA